MSNSIDKLNHRYNKAIRFNLLGIHLKGIRMGPAVMSWVTAHHNLRLVSDCLYFKEEV